MRYCYLILSFFLVCSLPIDAQILGPNTAVIGQPTTWTSGMLATTSYTWNVGNVSNQPLPAQLVAREVITSPLECADYPSVWFDPSNGHYYAFFLSGGITASAYSGQQNLWRVDLGTDPSSGTPPNNGNPTNLGNFGLGRGADCSHAIAYDSARGEWSCFLIKTGYNTSGTAANNVKIVRVDFGNTLANNPTTSTVINTPPIGGPVFELQAADSKVMYDQGNYILFIGNRWSQPARVVFGNDLQNVNPVCDLLPAVVTHGVGVGSGIAFRSSAIEFAYQNGNWYLFTTTTDAAGNYGAKLWRHDFGNSLLNTPTKVTGMAVPAMGSHHWALRIIPGKCANEFYGYAQHSQGYIERLDFNGNLESEPTVTGNVATRGNNGWPGIGPRTPWDPSGFATFIYKDSLYALTSGHSWGKLYITNLMYNFGSTPEHKYPTDNSFTHTFTGPPGNYDITLTVNMHGFGSAQFCKTITVVGMPLAPTYALAPADVCKVDTVVYVLDSIPGLTWEWNYTGSGVQYSATTTAARNELIFTSAATDGILQVRAVNSYGTSAWADTFIRVRQTPTVVVDPIGPHDICDGDSLRLIAVTTNAGAYEWFHNGNSTGVNTQQYYAKASGDYFVRVTTADKFCPVISDPVTINMYPQPIADLGEDIALCKSDFPIALRSSGNVSPGTHYLWSTGMSTDELYVNRGGYYWVEVSLGNCVHRDTIYIHEVEDPFVYLGADTTICEQFPLLIGTKIAGASYSWNTGASSSHISVNKTGSYVLAVNVEGCIVYDTIDVVAMPIPDINLGDDRDICPEQTVILDAAYGNSVYLWSTGEQTSSIAVREPGVYSVTVLTEHGCVGGDTVRFSLYPKPVVFLGADTTVCEETPLVLRPTVLNADSLIWFDGTVSEWMYITHGGEYIVSAVNKCGAVQDTVNVQDIFCEIFVPNAFSPNGDGINDVFRIQGNLGRIEFFSLSIYNRWGERIFHTNDKMKGWDGAHNGSPASLGTYVYLLQYEWDGKQFEQKGSFHLLR